jgi:hypothetical protein
VYERILKCERTKKERENNAMNEKNMSSIAIINMVQKIKIKGE